jgi:hypothetical protein
MVMGLTGVAATRFGAVAAKKSGKSRCWLKPRSSPLA